jgi:CRP-like cAMP-binding protein
MACLQERWLRDQVVRLGRRSAYERTVHLVLELHERLNAVGLAAGQCFALPLTQDVLADALGLSVVHVNRVLAQARRDGLFELRGGYVVIHGLERMEAAAPDNSAHPLRALAC